MEHLLDESPRFKIHVRWCKELPAIDSAEELFLSFGLEWELASQHDVKYDPKGPYVTLKARVLLLLRDLRSHIRGRATEYSQLRVIALPYTEA